MEDLFEALVSIAGIWSFLELAIEIGVKHGIKVDTYDHR